MRRLLFSLSLVLAIAVLVSCAQRRYDPGIFFADTVRCADIVAVNNNGTVEVRVLPEGGALFAGRCEASYYAKTVGDAFVLLCDEPDCDRYAAYPMSRVVLHR